MKLLKDEIPKEYRNRCGHCRSYIGQDKFCRYCGTPAGEGEFKRFNPESEAMQCVYGPPPVKRNHKCRACGYEWETCMMIDDQRFCPECGSDDTEVTEQDRFRN